MTRPEVEIVNFNDSESPAGVAAPAQATNETSFSDYATEGQEGQPFPLHCLGSTLETVGRAICITERVPESLVGCCLLGILSASIGKGLQVQSGANRFTRGNLYILASAQSGSGKSETFRHVARPFQEFEANLIKEWKAKELPGLHAEKELLEMDISRIKGSAKSGKVDREESRTQLEAKNGELQAVETRLHPPALSAEDVTTERLGSLLSHNGEQLASLSSDAGSIVNILLGGYSKLDRTDESLYLKAFSGDRHRTDRQTRAPVLLESPCLAALWLTQPDKLESLLDEDSLTDGGLIPRMLLCHTQCEAQEIGDDTQAIPEDVAQAYTGLIQGLLSRYRLADTPDVFTTDSEARNALKEHHNAIVRRRRGGGDLHDIGSFAARWNELAWRVSICLHAARHREQAGLVEMDLETARNAIALVEWFSHQQLAILSAKRDKAKADNLEKVLGLLADKPAGITARDVYRARIALSAEAAKALLDTMEQEGKISSHEVKPAKGGPVSRVYQRPKQR